jgi:hypothetical protein
MLFLPLSRTPSAAYELSGLGSMSANELNDARPAISELVGKNFGDTRSGRVNYVVVVRRGDAIVVRAGSAHPQCGLFRLDRDRRADDGYGVIK